MKPLVYETATDCATLQVTTNELHHDKDGMSYVQMNRYELESLRASIYTTLQAMDAIEVVANDSWSVGGVEKEITQADIDKETAEDERRAKYNDCY